MKISEIFGPTLQGEGMFSGFPCFFIRTSGCNLRCSWCLDEGSMVLMSDYTKKRLGDLKEGDEVIAINAKSEGGNVKYEKAKVTYIEKSVKECINLESDRGNLTLTPDHKLWKNSRSKWAESKDLVGHGVRYLGEPRSIGRDYLLGYLAGASNGDGCFWTLKKGDKEYRRYRIATNDEEIMQRVALALEEFDIDHYFGSHKRTGFSGKEETMKALYATKDKEAKRFESLVKENHLESYDWRRGYISGITDTDGSISSVVRITQLKKDIKNRIMKVCESHGLGYVVEESGIRIKSMSTYNFVLEFSPAVLRKADAGVLKEARGSAFVSGYENVGEKTVVKVSTTSGSYIANGFVVKNCDTKFASWSPEGDDYKIDDLMKEIGSNGWHGIKHVVISGGEPMMQKQIAELVDRLHEKDHYVTIETAGTIFKEDVRADLFSVSPKLKNSSPDGEENPKEFKIHTKNNTFENLDFFIKSDLNYQFKFVVKDRNDVCEIKSLVKRYNIPNEKVFIMPEGVDRDVIQSRLLELAEICKEENWILTNRLHVQIWGKLRGV